MNNEQKISNNEVQEAIDQSETTTCETNERSCPADTPSYSEAKQAYLETRQGPLAVMQAYFEAKRTSSETKRAWLAAKRACSEAKEAYVKASLAGETDDNDEQDSEQVGALPLEAS